MLLDFHNFVDRYGHDPKAIGLSFLAQIQVVRGFPDQATAHIGKAVAHAETLNFPYGVAHVHWLAAQTYLVLNNPSETEKHAKAMLQIALGKNFPLLDAIGLICAGWAEHLQGESDSLYTIEQGFDQLRTLGANVYQEVALISAHIDALMLSQQQDKAKERILYALGITEKLGCKWKLPELLRLKAVCILGQENVDTSEVEAILFESLNLALSLIHI